MPLIPQPVGVYALAIAAFVVFAVFHSVCAHEGFKQALARRTSAFFVDQFWRLLYCILSYGLLYHVALAPMYHQAANNQPLWAYPRSLDAARLTVRFAGLIVIYVAFIQSDFLSFLGLKQAAWGLLKLARLVPEIPRPPLFGQNQLVITGIYRWVRHPMLLGSIILELSSQPTVNNIVSTVVVIAYVLVGVRYEEERLIRVFGAPYERYRDEVGAFLPKLRLPGAKRLAAVP